MDPEKLLAILVSMYATQLRDISLSISRTHGNRIANKWAVPFVIRSLTSFDPQTIEGASIDINQIRRYNFEREARLQMKQLQSRPEVSFAITLLGGLPYEQIYSAARTADQIKDKLLYRGKAERDVLLRLPSDSDERQHVEEKFYRIKPMGQEDYKRWVMQFYGMLGREFQLLIALSQFFAEKTKIPFVGGQIKGRVDPLVQNYLGTREKPDWQYLPQDLQIVSGVFLPAYLHLEKDTFQKRYGESF